MKALFYRDWILYRWSLLWIAVLIVSVFTITAVLGKGMEFAWGVSAGMLVLGGLSMTMAAITTDAQSHTEIYLQAAPLRKSLIVTQRYLVFWAIALVSTVLVVGSVWFIGVNIPKLLIASLLIFIITFGFDLLLPCIYLLGPEKGVIPVIVIFTALFFAIGGLGATDMFNQQFAESILQHATVITVVALVLTILCNAVSLALSQAIFRRRIN